MVADSSISFNIDRQIPDTTSSRKVVVYNPPDSARQIIIPGLNEKKEKKLLKEIEKFQSKGNLKKFSWQLSPWFFSIIWRYRVSNNYLTKHSTDLEFVDKKESQSIKKVISAHRRYLEDSLGPGAVFYIPDREVNFNSSRRRKQPYSRSVLIASCNPESLVIIPISTKIKNANPRTDIILDFHRKDLSPDKSAEPFIDNRKYKLFAKPVVIRIQAAQTISKAHFLAVALLPKGRIARQLLEVVAWKMGKR